MRRSTKATQPIIQTERDQNYKFRCMEYLNFVLDQLMSDGTKFKLYFSHIENLLRNNLNDITIQDIEKIKRMLDEGEKIKSDVQQTGEFINYDLIKRQKYTLKRTHFYLQQAPNESLLYLQGFSPYTLEQVQMSKLDDRIEKLQDKNYSMLDMMFKLPEAENKYENQLEKQGEFKISTLEGENPEFEFEKFNAQKDPLEPLQQKPQPSKLTDSKHADDKIVVEEPLGKEIQQEQKRVIVATPQKPKQKTLEKSIEGRFVEIKKKTKKKKTENPSAEKPVNIPLQPSPNPEALKPQKPQLQNQVKPSPQKNLQQNPQPNSQRKQSIERKESKQQNGNSQSIQKRKYVRKIPLEPKAQKSQKQKPSKEIKKSKQKSQEIKFQISELQKIQSNVELALMSQAAELTNLLGTDLLAIRTDDKEKDKPIQELLVKDLTKKETKIKKQRKPMLENKEKEDSKKHKQQNEGKELEIILPYPNCEQEVKQLKIEMENLNKILKEESMAFNQNMAQAINVLAAIKPQIVDHEKVQIVLPIFEEPQLPQAINLKPQDNPAPIQPQIISLTPEQSVEQIKQISMIQALKQQTKNLNQQTKNLKQQTKNLKQQTKKIKSTPKQFSKKHHPSSEQYKPGQCQISESESEEESKEGDYYQPGKAKKIKKKHSKKKGKKDLSKINKDKPNPKSVQKIQKISQEPGGKPSESLISVDTQTKKQKVILTPQQRQRLKQERQKLKEKRQKQKEEKMKLKKLEQLQKQVLILKIVDKSQKSSKQQKQGEKKKKESISKINESSSLALVSQHEQKKQFSMIAVGSQEQKPQVNIVQLINAQMSQQQHQMQVKLNEHQMQLQLNEQAQKKNPLNSSSVNSSTREDISLSFVSVVGIQKSFSNEGKIDELQLVIIQQSQKIETDKLDHIETNQQDIKERQPGISQIPVTGRLSTSFQQYNDSFDLDVKLNQARPRGSPKRQKSQGLVDSAEKEQIGQVTKKKIKVTFKESYVFEDPQYGIEVASNQKQMYTIQVFERSPSKNSGSQSVLEYWQKQNKSQEPEENNHQMDQREQNIYEKYKENQRNQAIYGEQQANSSSLSAGDD